jgi:hypothetical protein
VAALPLSDDELRFLDALIEHGVRFMVVGLSAAALQGAPVVTQDVDLWFEDIGDERIRKALRDIGATYIPPLNLNPPMFVGTGAAMFDIVLTMSGLRSFSEELRECMDVPLGNHRLKVLSLRRVLVSKRAANRLKDRLVIPVLEDALAVQETGPGPILPPEDEE